MEIQGRLLSEISDLRVEKYKMKNIYITKFYSKYFESSASKRYVEWGKSVLDEAASDDCLVDLDLLIIAGRSNEFDADCGVDFAEHYGIKKKIFVVVDQGVLAPINAMKIILRYLDYDEYKNAMLLVMEQPCKKDKNSLDLSEKTAAVALRFEKNDLSSKDSLRLIAAGLSDDVSVHTFNASKTVHVNYPSCIYPLMYFDHKSLSMIGQGIYTMIVHDVGSERKGYVVWERFKKRR